MVSSKNNEEHYGLSEEHHKTLGYISLNIQKVEAIKEMEKQKVVVQVEMASTTETTLRKMTASEPITNDTSEIQRVVVEQKRVIGYCTALSTTATIATVRVIVDDLRSGPEPRKRQHTY